MSGESPAEVRQIAVPSRLRTTSTLACTDYEDAFRLRPARPVERTAPEWARAVLEEAPAPLRRTLLTAWGALGLVLGDVPAQGFVLGWELRRCEPDRAVLATESPLGIAGELVFEGARDELLYGTFVRLDGEAAARAWALIEPKHPPVVRQLLELAGSRGARPGAAQERARSRRTIHQSTT